MGEFAALGVLSYSVSIAYFMYLNVVQLLLVCGVGFSSLMRIYVVMGCFGMVVMLGAACVLLISRGHSGCAPHIYPVLLGVLVFHLVDSCCISPFTFTDEDKKAIEEAIIPDDVQRAYENEVVYEAVPTGSP